MKRLKEQYVDEPKWMIDVYDELLIHVSMLCLVLLPVLTTVKEFQKAVMEWRVGNAAAATTSKQTVS